MPCVYPRERTTERTDNPSTPADIVPCECPPEQPAAKQERRGVPCGCEFPRVDCPNDLLKECDWHRTIREERDELDKLISDRATGSADLTDEQLGEIEGTDPAYHPADDPIHRVLRALVAEVRRSRAELAALRDVAKAVRIADKNHDPVLCLACDERAGGPLCCEHQGIRDAVAALDRIDGGGS